jgi:hypothetical protein
MRRYSHVHQVASRDGRDSRISPLPRQIQGAAPLTRSGRFRAVLRHCAPALLKHFSANTNHD